MLHDLKKVMKTEIWTLAFVLTQFQLNCFVKQGYRIFLVLITTSKKEKGGGEGKCSAYYSWEGT